MAENEEEIASQGVKKEGFWRRIGGPIARFFRFEPMRSTLKFTDADGNRIKIPVVENGEGISSASGGWTSRDPKYQIYFEGDDYKYRLVKAPVANGPDKETVKETSEEAAIKPPAEAEDASLDISNDKNSITSEIAGWEKEREEYNNSVDAENNPQNAWEKAYPERAASLEKLKTQLTKTEKQTAQAKTEKQDIATEIAGWEKEREEYNNSVDAENNPEHAWEKAYPDRAAKLEELRRQSTTKGKSDLPVTTIEQVVEPDVLDDNDKKQIKTNPQESAEQETSTPQTQQTVSPTGQSQAPQPNIPAATPQPQMQYPPFGHTPYPQGGHGYSYMGGQGWFPQVSFAGGYSYMQGGFSGGMPLYGMMPMPMVVMPVVVAQPMMFMSSPLMAGGMFNIGSGMSFGANQSMGERSGIQQMLLKIKMRLDAFDAGLGITNNQFSDLSAKSADLHTTVPTDKTIGKR